jgi:D-beta-D-heptose 7-phosphate kinase/D-beta-D-heptose 1-phosphate adenosyltransferase
VVFTNGCYDLLHAGHVQTLQFARSKGDLLVVGLNSDRSVRRLKGPGRPILPQADRSRVLAALEAVDYVVLFDEDTPAALVKALRPDVLVKGEDYKGKEVVGSAHAGRVELAPLVKGLSTSDIVRRIRSNGP